MDTNVTMHGGAVLTFRDVRLERRLLTATTRRAARLDARRSRSRAEDPARSGAGDTRTRRSRRARLDYVVVSGRWRPTTPTVMPRGRPSLPSATWR